MFVIYYSSPDGNKLLGTVFQTMNIIYLASTGG